MVDAYEAVKLSLDLQNSGIPIESYSPYLQLHVSSVTQDLQNSSTIINGIAWAQQGEISAIEYNLDGGVWYEATYEEINSSSNLPFNWSINLDPSKLSEKNYTLQIRGVGAGDSAEQYSLLSIVIVQGTGDNEDSSNGFNNILLIVLSLVLFAILLIFMMAQVKQPELLPSNKLEITGENLSGNEILEAEILDVVDDFEKKHRK